MIYCAMEDRKQHLRQQLLNQSKAIRTLVLPEVIDVIKSVSVDHSSVRHFETDIINWLKPMIDLSGFSVYPMNGITEGLNWWYGRERRSVMVQVGDYQWIESKQGQTPAIRYISVPAALDGDFLAVPFEEPIALDLAYVGSTAKREITIGNNVEYVFFSLSKSFGVRNLRTGWIFTRYPDHKLNDLIYGAKYYNYYAQDVAQRIITKFSIDYVYHRLRDQQQSVCHALNLNPSHSVWLATSCDDEWLKFRRTEKVARICLAPIYKL